MGTIRCRSTPVYIDAHASLITGGASFSLEVHQSDFEVHKHKENLTLCKQTKNTQLSQTI